MGIFLRQSHNVPPLLWGSPDEVRFSIWDNLEDTYGCNHKSEVLIMPMFWGFPLLDYSINGYKTTNHNSTYKDGKLFFNGTSAYTTTDSAIKTLNNFTISGWYYPIDGANQDYIWSLGYNNTDSFLMFKGSANELKYYPYSHASIQETGIYLTISALQNIVIKREGGTITAYVDMVSDEKSVDAYAITKKFELGWAVQRNSALDYFEGKAVETRISNVARTADQVALFYENPYGLYRRVSKPIWSIPAAPSIYIPQIIMF